MKRRVVVRGHITIGTKRTSGSRAHMQEQAWDHPFHFHYHDRALYEHRVMKRHDVKKERATAREQIEEAAYDPR